MAAIDANGWAVIIGAASLALTNILVLVLQFLSSRKSDASRKDSDEKLDKIVKGNEDIHTLVNSDMGVQLTLNKVTTRRLALMTKDPEDKRIADLAEVAWNKHMEQQKVVDAASRATPA